MNITKQEAQASLAEIENAITLTQKAMGHFTGYILMLWGVIWMFGFSATQFCPEQANWTWLALDVVGFIGTFICVKKSRYGARRPGGRRVGYAWLILSGYFMLWCILLQPQGRQIIAFASTVFMCAYMVMGLWLGRLLFWLGLTVTVLTLVGYFALPAWFALWMAVVGGGALFISGLSICKTWK
jgi:hypothetical protein